jgi:hypothetical protein
VFQYLVELHAAKAAAGHLPVGPAAQPLEPAGGDALAGGRAGGGVRGGGGGGEPFAVVELMGRSPEPGKGGDGKGSDEALDVGAPPPSATGLQPSKRRGQRTLGQRVKQLFQK